MSTLLVLWLLARPPEPPARVYTWAGAVEEFPALGQYRTLATRKAVEGFAPKRVFVRLGGTCVALQRTGATASVVLGEGSRDGHTWKWEFSLSFEGASVRLDGPGVKHGVDRVGDGRIFHETRSKKTLFASPPEGGVLALHAATHSVEIACWGEGTSTSTCSDGGSEQCHTCTLLRLMGGPKHGQKLLGDGVIRADLTRGCGDPCPREGLRWVDFESLVNFVKQTPVTVADEAPVGALFATKEACQAAPPALDLAPDWKPQEPVIPPLAPTVKSP